MATLFSDQALHAALSDRLKALATRKSFPELRGWVAGCADGEDAYACVILLHEAVEQFTASSWSIKVFATDADPQLLSIARSGVYPAARLAMLAPRQCELYFTTIADRCHVRAHIRDRVIFAAHDLLHDPPFARLDLIICRSLFVSLAPDERIRVLERFAYALRPGGLLILAEEPPAEDGRFCRAHSHSPLYTYCPASETGAFVEDIPDRLSAGKMADAPQVAHPALIVDAQSRIVYLSPGVERFLRIGAGKPSYQLFDVIHPDLREALQTTLLRADTHARAAESQPILMASGDTRVPVTIVVQPLPREYRADGRLIVIFDIADRVVTLDEDKVPTRSELALASELADLQDQHTFVLAQHSVAIEELQTTNEEQLLLNEELRAATEELDARREELQTLNEELLTINQEQKQTLAELGWANADLQNLMASTDIGTLFLDRQLRLKRFTPQVREIFNLIQADLGRPLAHLTHQLQYDGLIDDARQLLDSLMPSEREVPHGDGRWFLLRLRPYYNAGHQVDGVVLTFLDISERRRAEEALRVSKTQLLQSHDELERRVDERTAELVEAHIARKRLLREIVQAQEAERRRIARDLHDQTGQQITAILLALKVIHDRAEGQNELLGQLEHVRGIVQTIGKEMHQMAIDLRPTALDDVGLAEALQGYAESWSRRTGIAVDLFVTGIKRKSLPAEIETTVYRVVLEALTNIVRHAHASQVNLILERHGNTMVVMIEDNGHGFDVEATLQLVQRDEHIGLLGMRERVALVDGALSIESSPGSGTTVIVRIPLEKGDGYER